MRRLLLAAVFVLSAASVSAQPIGVNPATLASPVVVFPGSALNSSGVVSSSQLLLPDGSVGAPSVAFASEPTLGFSRRGSQSVDFNAGSQSKIAFSSNTVTVQSGGSFNWSSSATDAGGAAADLSVVRDAANTLALRNGVSAQTFKIGPTTAYASIASANLVTIPTDSTSVEFGGVTRFRSSSTITPATAGVGNCAAAFQAAALTADCTIATLPAGMKLVAIYADVTVGFTCSGTCTGTKVMQAGTAAGGTQILAASLNVAATGQFGLADADLGSGMTRAAAIQGGLIGSWSATTPVSVRFTSGTGNWGSGAATFVNAGSVKFTLITEQVK